MVVIALTAVLVACPAPGSRSYQPISDWERAEFERADRSIYPDDVRNDIAKYQSTVVAWTGIIKDVKVFQVEEGFDLYFLLEHHYYDWIEDFGIQQERIFLSPRGEGLFTTRWEVVAETTQAEISDMTEVGKLVIAYGEPWEVGNNSIIAAEASYIRPIGREWYTTEKLDYGRLNEPSETE